MSATERYSVLPKPLCWAWVLFTGWLILGALHAKADDQWFEDFKQRATDRELYTFLYAMPKGGDIHNHMSGSGLSEWWYELALEQRKHGYEFYTKVKINNCRRYGHDEFGGIPYLMLFHNILASTYERLDSCEQQEYKPLRDLDEDERQAWKDSIRLNQSHEGRDEFFQRHWERLDQLLASPYLMMEILYRNMEAFGQEGLIYLETMMGAGGFRKPDGTPIPPDEVADMYRERLKQRDALGTGVTVRMQASILRFAANAEQQLKDSYDFVSRNRDLYLAVNMVGREDNDKGYPLRFKDTLRELRHRYHNVRLSIHAGELDEPNTHVRDTLMLGADRIGHGLEVITDDDLLRQMRHGPYLIEINLISNLLLEYVDDYSQHPFPEYLRIGIPVALSTDDRGMWDSNLTDEFFVAVKEFNLSWSEIKRLSRNSLTYGFMGDDVKSDLVARYNERIRQFEQNFERRGPRAFAQVPVESYGFICRHYGLCNWD